MRGIRTTTARTTLPDQGGGSSRSSRPSWILLDLILLGAVLSMSGQIATPMVERGRRRSELRMVALEAHALYDAFQRYYAINHAYPDAIGDPGFDLATQEPLRRRGYYLGSIAKHLMEGRIDAYDSPSDQGSNREFWLEMTLMADPSTRLLVTRSDGAPLGRGEWRDGVFVVHGGKIEPL